MFVVPKCFTGIGGEFLFRWQCYWLIIAPDRLWLRTLSWMPVFNRLPAIIFPAEDICMLKVGSFHLGLRQFSHVVRVFVMDPATD